MTLPTGTKLGPYEIVAAIGSGGMGEVYKARDTRLERVVAIKVLPESMAKDSARLTRFQQEARALSALNHPNLLAILMSARRTERTLSFRSIWKGRHYANG